MSAVPGFETLLPRLILPIPFSANRFLLGGIMFFRQEARNIWLSFFLCFSHLPVALDSSLSCTHEFRRLDFLGKVTRIPSVLVNLIAVQRVLKSYNVDNTVFERQQLGRCRAPEERHKVTQRLEKTRKKPLSTGYPNPACNKQKGSLLFC